MPDPFEFTVPPGRLELGTDRTTATVVDVTNRLGRRTEVGFDAVPGEGADGGWFGPVQPTSIDLADGGSTRVTLPIKVAADAPAGDVTCQVRAFAVEDPQRDFAISPTITVAIPERERPDGPPVWLLALVGAVVVAVVAVGVWLLIRDGGGEVVAVVGRPVADARDALADADVSVFADSSTDPGSGCVALQVPGGGEEADDVALLVTACPVPAPEVPLPAAYANPLCGESFDFCRALEARFGRSFATDESWLEARDAQVQAFVDAFTVEGVPVPELVGLRVAEAGAELVDLRGEPVDDGTAAASPCVLFQQPPAGVVAAKGSAVTFVQTGCPAAAPTAAAVVIPTPLPLGPGYTGLCTQAARFCAAVEADPTTPADFTSSPAFAEVLAGQEALFRARFTERVVPDVVGSTERAARNILAGLGFEVQTLLDEPETSGPFGDVLIFRCYTVRDQDPDGGTPASSLSSQVVSLLLERADVRTCLPIFNEFERDIEVLDRPFTER